MVHRSGLVFSERSKNWLDTWWQCAICGLLIAAIVTGTALGVVYLSQPNRGARQMEIPP